MEQVTVRALSEGVVHFTGSSGATWSTPRELCLRSSLFLQLLSVSDDGDDLRPPAKAPKLDQDATQEDAARAQGSVRAHNICTYTVLKSCYLHLGALAVGVCVRCVDVSRQYRAACVLWAVRCLSTIYLSMHTFTGP